MNSFTNKRLLTPKKLYKAENLEKETNVNENYSAFSKGVKRKTEDTDELPFHKRRHTSTEASDTKSERRINTTAQAKRYSANERLKNYRKNLEKRANEIVKVHQVLSTQSQQNVSSKVPNLSKTGNKISVSKDTSLSHTSTHNSPLTRNLSASSPKYLVKNKGQIASCKDIFKQSGNVRYSLLVGKDSVTSGPSVNRISKTKARKYESESNISVLKKKIIPDSLSSKKQLRRPKIGKALSSSISGSNKSVLISPPSDNDLCKVSSSSREKGSSLKSSKSKNNDSLNSILKYKQGFTSTPKNTYENKLSKSAINTSASLFKKVLNKPSSVQKRLLAAKNSPYKPSSAMYEETINTSNDTSDFADTSRTLSAGYLFNESNFSKEFTSRFSEDSSLQIGSSNLLACNIGNISNIDDDLDYEMDWSPIDEEQIVSDIQKLRHTIKDQIIPTMANTMENTEVHYQYEPSDDANLYVVIDTNVFISNLELLKNIMNINIYGIIPIIYIPWMVAQELDCIKDGRTNAKNAVILAAKKAIIFIHENLKRNNLHFKGQTVHEASKLMRSESADDAILFCCINFVEKSKTTILFSNDTHLRSKALINNITTAGQMDILQTIKDIICSRNVVIKKSKVERIKNIFTKLCNIIIQTEIESGYGVVAKNMLSEPPWSLSDCFMYFKRFWGPIFSLIITQKQCKKIIDDFISFISSHQDLTSESDIDEFVKLCLSLCIYFKNSLFRHEEAINDCINNIQNIAS